MSCLTDKIVDLYHSPCQGTEFHLSSNGATWTYFTKITLKQVVTGVLQK